jgi:hypothetical protein
MADADHVQVRVADFPSDWPDGTGDLVVLSEIAYYLTDEGLAVASARLERWLEPTAHVVAVHYTGDTDYPRPGASIAPWLDAQPWLERLVSIADPSFDLGVWARV